MTMHPETAGKVTPDGDSQTDESTNWTDPEGAAEANAAADLKSTDPQPAAEGGSDTEARSDAESMKAGDGPAPAPAPSRGTETGPGEAATGTAGAEPLLSEEARQELGSRWSEIQGNFVDHPQGSVQEADALVVDVMQRVTGSLSNERERLESQWRQGDDVSTEDLRVALTRYRTFFDRLLSA
jgi:hypothetical protein